MTDYRKFYDKQYLGSWDLEGKDVTVTIEKVTGAELISEGNKKNRKPVAHIVGTAKKLVINATNGKTIASLYGKDVRNWCGKRITLYATTTTFGKETHDCIRVRPKVPDEKPGKATTQQQEQATEPPTSEANT